MNPDAFKALLQQITGAIGNRPLDQELHTWLNTEHGATSPLYQQLKSACEVGVAEGWLAQREQSRAELRRKLLRVALQPALGVADEAEAVASPIWARYQAICSGVSSLAFAAVGMSRAMASARREMRGSVFMPCMLVPNSLRGAE